MVTHVNAAIFGNLTFKIGTLAPCEETPLWSLIWLLSLLLLLTSSDSIFFGLLGASATSNRRVLS